ncbi:MAG: enoyl-CoA hydratase/isomerase family protein, partial [Thermoleophilaceae bacterium]|nr:enoyl-CoA hydratase/isomerase family protein [Thermoleophilaceae bacterium]
GEAPFIADRGFAGIAQRSADKPLIAAIEGNALAGGLEIALSCDLIVASEESRLGIPEAKRGLVAAGGALIRLPKRIPYHLAMELALTGEPISAARAAEFGLVNRLAPAGGALDAALEIAGAIARNGPLAVDASKRIIRGALDWSEQEAWDKQQEFAGPVFGSQDAQEGARAFAEKRDPAWTGR